MKFLKEDIVGGLLNAALLLYALILSPSIIAQGVGQDYFGALMTTTIIVTILFTLANGIYAHVPFAQSVYMGENAFFAFGLVGAGIPFPTALGIVFWAGVLFLIFSVSGLRKKFAQAIPRNLSLVWGFAVSLFLLYLAFFDAGLFKASSVPGMPTLPANYNTLSVFSFFILAILIVFLYKKLPEAIKGVAMLASIALALIIAPVIFNTAYPALNFGIEDPSKVIFILNFVDALNYLHLILIFLLIELVDVTGTLKALLTPMKLGDEDKVIGKVMHVEGVSTSVGALFGQPTVGTYIESAGAVSVGAKSGNASIVTAIAFLPVLFITPFFSKLPLELLLWATAPALAAVSGFILVKVLKEIDFQKKPENAFLLLLTFPGIFGGNLLIAFVLPMIALAGYEYFTENKASKPTIILSLIGLITLYLYHF
ncbi:MAG: NCS2 family permease [Candidatus Methanoperedens sp.]|nr:NCS2 family permease [Candidatus Methanoperedens sp.]